MGQGTTGIIMVIILFALMYFLMIHPQKKRQRKHADTLKKLQKGDHVVTIGRLHGTIDSIDRSSGTVTLDCDGIYLIFDLKAIASVDNQSNNPSKKDTKKVSKATKSTSGKKSTKNKSKNNK